MIKAFSTAELISFLDDARARTTRLIADLSSDQLIGPRLPIVNPLRWEIGHLAWFHEFWILRHLDDRAPLLPQADALYDSSNVPHDRRWDLPLPSFDDTLAYMQAVQNRVRNRLHAHGDMVPEKDAYFYLLTIFHEDMHAEAFNYMRQTLAYPPPAGMLPVVTPAGPLTGDVDVAGGVFLLGAAPGHGFVFDNEKWAHPVHVEPFRIARAPVTNAEYARFVEDSGYLRREFWDDAGWDWRTQSDLTAPVYWRRGKTGWEARHFDRWIAPSPHAPVMHVSWHEAQAWCRWAGRRLPSESEWEMAAACEHAHNGYTLAEHKRRYPWGDAPPTSVTSNLNSTSPGPVDVAALAQGDSAFGCRQMMGNVWEWTASAFVPYPGFSPDPYRDYSMPWFGTHKVLRGGSWATPARLLRNTWRNFFVPERNDIFAGFRTCALQGAAPRTAVHRR